LSGDNFSDADAVLALQQGDENALRLLYDRYLDRVFRFALRLVGRSEEAEEIAADAFLQVFRHARDYRGDGEFSGWLFRIARNLCLDRLRRGRWLQVISLEELSESGWNLSQDTPDREPILRLAVQEALQQLPPDYRSVLLMRDVDGLTNPETAQALGRSPAAAKSLHFRARQTLRDALAGVLGMEER
jgi:RNA polymerase sigma-70 factor (ECF subfamily)